MATDTGSDELSETAGGEHNRIKSLGKYRIERRIGAGGMGTVFLAVDDSLNRTVALKVLPKDRAGNPVLVRRFKAEGQAAAHMEHPNIVRVFEAGEADGFLYMALEYVEGIDVHELVERRGVVPVKRSTDIIRQTTLALQHAQEKGIVHRDIKPSNLLIKRDGTVKLADMGLARSVDDTLETNITRAGTTVGTVDYMSPEQARNSKGTDVRSDLYSLGCTWYHMLTGQPPFPDGGMTNKLQAHAVSVRPDPRTINPGVPEGIVAIIQRLMAIKPEDRHQTPQDLLDDLESAGRMHRNVDESVLAGLAEEGDWESAHEIEEEAGLRIEEDVDLSGLNESGEHDIAEPSQATPIRPRSKNGKPAKRHKRSPARTPVEDEPPEDADRSRFKTKPSKSKTGSTPTSVRRTAPGSDSDSDVPSDPTRKSKSNRKSKPPKPTHSQRGDRSQKTKRGSVRAIGGEAPALPGKDAVVVDASAKTGFDLETLKYAIPAVLVVLAIVGVGFAVIRSSGGLTLSGGDNPYADGRPQESPVPAVDAGGPRADPPAPVEVDVVPAVPQVSAVPFPGAEGEVATSDEKPLVPNWVNAFRSSGKGAERSVVVRRRPSGGATEVATINAALKRLPRGGGTIEIDGDGPFRVQQIELSNIDTVRMRAAEGCHPVLHLHVPKGWTAGSVLQFRNCRYIELEGVHLVLVDAGPQGSSVLEVINGNLSLHNCSITIDRNQTAAMSAIRLAGRPARLGVAATGKCLLENVVIRGDNATSVLMDGPADDLVAGNCLFASGDAPAIVIHDNGSGGTAQGVDPPTRGIRLLASVVVSSQAALQLTHQLGKGEAVLTDIVTRQTVLARSAQAASVTPAMAKVEAWPSSSGGLGESRVDRLTWDVEQSYFVGWEQLLTLTDGTAAVSSVGASSDQWRTFWAQGLNSKTIVAEALVSPSPSRVTPDILHAELSTLMEPMHSKRIAGVRPEEVPELPQGLIAHVAAASRQPYEPDKFGAHLPIQGEPVPFDLSTRRNLSAFLSSDACPDGTHVIATGSGLKELDPILIENKSVRVEFVSQGKTPLLLQPKATREGTTAEEGFITLKNATLDLVNAPIKMPASRTTAYPKSAILLDDASLSLRHSRIEGPRVDTGEVAPLIRWTDQTPTADRTALLENSFLISRSTLLSGPIHWQRLIVRNCVLASEAEAFSVAAQSADQLPAHLVIDHSTIAAVVAIRAAIDPGAATDGQALNVYSRASVFAGPLEGDPMGSAVLAHSPGAAKSGAIVWWGSANGYSNGLKGFRIDGNSVPGDFAHDWQQAWGTGHEANALTGKADVLFANSNRNLQLLDADAFTLSDAATASTWGPSMEPLGADAESVGPSHSEEASATAKKGQSPTTPPINRRNLGF